MEPTTTVGYLEKLGAIGIKAWRLRWFVLDHASCLAFYYESPKRPPSELKGFIDLSQASFEFDLEGTDQGQHVFKITTFAREYHVRADTREHMLEWIDAMHSARRTFLQDNSTDVLLSRMCPRTGHEGVTPPLIEKKRMVQIGPLEAPTSIFKNMSRLLPARLSSSSTSSPSLQTPALRSGANTARISHHDLEQREVEGGGGLTHRTESNSIDSRDQHEGSAGRGGGRGGGDGGGDSRVLGAVHEQGVLGDDSGEEGGTGDYHEQQGAQSTHTTNSSNSTSSCEKRGAPAAGVAAASAVALERWPGAPTDTEDASELLSTAATANSSATSTRTGREAEAGTAKATSTTATEPSPFHRSEVSSHPSEVSGPGLDSEPHRSNTLPSRFGRGLSSFASMMHRRPSSQQQQQQPTGNDGVQGNTGAGDGENGNERSAPSDQQQQHEEQGEERPQHVGPRRHKEQDDRPDRPPPPQRHQRRSEGDVSSAQSDSSIIGLGRRATQHLVPKWRIGRRARTEDSGSPSSSPSSTARANERYLNDFKRTVLRLQTATVQREDRILDLYRQNVAKDAVIEYCSTSNAKERLELFQERSVRMDELQAKLLQAATELEATKKKAQEYKAEYLKLQSKRSDHVRVVADLQAQLHDRNQEVRMLRVKNAELKRQQEAIQQQSEHQYQTANTAAELQRSRQENQLLFQEKQVLAQALREKDQQREQLAEELHQLFKEHIKVLSQQSGVSTADSKKIQELSEANGFEECDEFIEGEYDSLGFKVRTLAHLYIHSAEEQARERDREANWRSLLERHGNRVLIDAFREAKELARGGIPHSRRAHVWRLMIHYHTRREMRRPYNPSDYEASITMFTKQIDLDLMRTFPHHRDFSRADSDAVQKLRRVLVTFSHRYPDIGYCQGLNMIAGLLLLLVDEETAFWGLVAAVNRLQPKDYYNASMLGVQVDQRVLRDLLRSRFRRVGWHLERLSTDFSLLTFNFLLTIGIDAVPIETALRILDTFWCEGNKVLFRFALSMFGMHEKEILQRTDRMQLFEYFRTMGKRLYDVETLFDYAFRMLNSGLQGFSKQAIDKRRAEHDREIRAEMQQLERQRREIEAETERKRRERQKQKQEQRQQREAETAQEDDREAATPAQEQGDAPFFSPDATSPSSREKRRASRFEMQDTDSDDSEVVLVTPRKRPEFDSVSFASLKRSLDEDEDDDDDKDAKDPDSTEDGERRDGDGDGDTGEGDDRGVAAEGGGRVSGGGSLAGGSVREQEAGPRKQDEPAPINDEYASDSEEEQTAAVNGDEESRDPCDEQSVSLSGGVAGDADA